MSPFNVDLALEICRVEVLAQSGGIAASQNTADAARSLKQAADQGNPAVMTELAYFMLHISNASAADKAKALDLLKKATAKGDSNAMVELGIAYREGNGVTRDVNQAARWFLDGWKKENQMAEIQWGMLYYRGEQHGKPQGPVTPQSQKAADISIGRSTLSVAAASRKNPDLANLARRIFAYMATYNPEPSASDIRGAQQVQDSPVDAELRRWLTALSKAAELAHGSNESGKEGSRNCYMKSEMYMIHSAAGTGSESLGQRYVWTCE